jgi:hypothetical protein
MGLKLNTEGMEEKREKHGENKTQEHENTRRPRNLYVFFKLFETI